MDVIANNVSNVNTV
ncbi:MAG: hypothetical protein FWF50_00815, partial [Defluviitaleaceae bacterium]|nr:hypothetical protein [Defluviitaleaceae bacterium]